MSFPANGWLAHVRPDPAARLRLFCFPYSGASAAVFAGWQASLPGIEVCPVQLPGRGSRISEPLCTTLAGLMEPLAGALRPLLEARPFALFGHSLGAVIAFELARHARRRFGVLPLKLVVSGHTAPDLAHGHEPMHELPDPEFVSRLEGIDGTAAPALADPELRQLLLPVLRADFQMCETYRAENEEPLACPITAFGGSGDPAVTAESLMGWRAYTSSAFAVSFFGGGHLFISSARGEVLAALAGELRAPGYGGAYVRG